MRFYTYIWTLRREYDVVFVHMNQEYVILGWKLWWILGKRIVFWRNHKNGSWLTRFAAFVSHRVCYTSPKAYVATYKNAVRMPVGIDTDLFRPCDNVPIQNAVLFLGRFDAVKRPELFLEAMEILSRDDRVMYAHVYGEATRGREHYAREVRERFAHLTNVTFFGAVRNDEAPVIYAHHRVYVNLTPAGSFDKTILEAAACGCLVVTANAVLRDVVPPEMFVDDMTPSSVARAVRCAFAYSESHVERLVTRQRLFVEHEHSLDLLITRLMGILSA